MGFYDEIATYYDYIFPVKDAQLNFIKKTTGKAPKTILDVACGSGGYSLALANSGYTMTAVDLDQKMIEETIQKAKENSVDINAFKADMLSIDRELNGEFNTLFCIGNSVAHLDSEEQIEDFLKITHNALTKGGHLIVQIINYDRVLERGINALPTVTNNEINLRFDRLYEHHPETDKILFITRLTVNGNTFDNVIPLLPIRSERFISLVKSAGFKEIDLFGDFNETPFDSLESYHLVIRATKE